MRRCSLSSLTASVLLGLAAVAGPSAAVARPVYRAAVTIDFGAAPVGSEVRRDLGIHNSGNVPLTFTAQVTGPFRLSSPLDQMLAPGETKLLTVIFQPVLPGPAIGLLRVFGSANGVVTQEMDASLSGVGIVPQPALAVSPPALDFNQVDVGSERRRTLVLTNTGQGPANVRSLSIPRGPFFLATPFSGPLAPGESRSLGVIFHPVEPGPATATLAIASDDPTTPLLAVRLAGAGFVLPAVSPRLVVSPEAIDLGQLPAGQSAGATVTLRNAGTAPLAVTSLLVRGTGWSANAPPAPFQLAPAAAIEVALRFTAAAPGPAPGELQVLSNDPARPEVRVPLLALVKSPIGIPAGFAVEVSPGVVRVLPESPASVVYTLRALAGRAVRVRCGEAVVELPAGSRTLATRPCQLDLPADGTPVELQDVVVLPEGALAPGVREVRFLRAFFTSTGSEAHQAAVRLLPSGSLSADFAVTTVTVDFPIDGSAVRERSVLRARALVSGVGTGSALGVWRVDGVPFETFTVDLVGGRPAVLETRVPLPTVLLGLHELDLELRRPALLQTAAVRYLVTEGDLDRLRWTLPPGFRAYLKAGTPPEWSWTPKPGAQGYEVRIDGGTAGGEGIRTLLPDYELTPELLDRLAAGEHRIEVRALFASPSLPEPRPPLDDDRLIGTFAVLDGPSRLDLGLAEGELRWSGPLGEGVFTLVAVEPASGTPRLRRVTTGRQVPLASLASLVAPSPGLAWHVEAYNDQGERVGESASIEIPQGEKP